MASKSRDTSSDATPPSSSKEVRLSGAEVPKHELPALQVPYVSTKSKALQQLSNHIQGAVCRSLRQRHVLQQAQPGKEPEYAAFELMYCS